MSLLPAQNLKNTIHGLPRVHAEYKKKYFYVQLARSALWHPCKIASKEWKGIMWKKRFLAWFGALYRHFRMESEGETTKLRRHDGRSPGLPGYDAREPAAWPRWPVRQFEVFMLRTKNGWSGADWTRPISITLEFFFFVSRAHGQCHRCTAA